MNITKQNQQFDATEGLTKAQIALLTKEGRIASTTARMNAEEATEAIGVEALGLGSDVDGRVPFGGYIITRSPMRDPSKEGPESVLESGWEEARWTVANRPFGEEEVVGCLCKTIPVKGEDHTDHAPSPSEIKSN